MACVALRIGDRLDSKPMVYIAGVPPRCCIQPFPLAVSIAARFGSLGLPVHREYFAAECTNWSPPALGGMFFMCWELSDSQETECASVSSAVAHLAAFSTPGSHVISIHLKYSGVVKAPVDRTWPEVICAIFRIIFVKCAPGIRSFR